MDTDVGGDDRREFICKVSDNLYLVTSSDKLGKIETLYKHSFAPQKLPCPVENNAHTKDKLRYYRTLKGLTQKQAATLIGIDRSTYIRWENGETKHYHQSKLAKAAEVFGCALCDICDRYNMFIAEQSANLKAIRKKLSLTQKEFADMLGVTYDRIKAWEQDRVRMSRKWFLRIEGKGG